MEEQESAEEFPATAADEGVDEGVTEAALREAEARLGYRHTPEPVAELANVLRRGNDVVALAGEGSGKELLYALAAAEGADPGSPAVQALVLCPTPEAAGRAGRALHLLGADRGLAALTWLPWREVRAGDEPPFAQLLAGRPSELLPQVQAGRLKLGELAVLAVDGVSALEATGGWPAVEALLDTLPSEVQKVLTDVRRSERLDALVKHRVSRAKKWPAELFAPGAGKKKGTSARLLWAAGAGEEERLDRLADTLHQAAAEAEDAGAVVRCPDGATAHRVAASLSARGFELTDRLDEPGVVVAWGEDEPPPENVGVLYGLPLSLEELGRWLGGAAVRAVVIPPSELDQLRLLARRAGWGMTAVPERPSADARDAIQAFRERVRRRLEGHEDAAEALVLEPLLRAYGASRVAGALSALLREREPPTADAEAEPEDRPGPERPAAARRTPEPTPESRPPRGAASRGRDARSGPAGRTDWTRLFISAGKRDDVGPGDLVGAITGETPAEGGQIGRIEIRESYALVDVAPDVAEQVMDQLTGVRIKGREVIARLDRKE